MIRSLSLEECDKGGDFWPWPPREWFTSGGVTVGGAGGRNRVSGHGGGRRGHGG